MSTKLQLSAIVVVVGLAVGWYFLEIKGDTRTSFKSECPRIFQPSMSAEPYYQGELFDAHLHLPVASKTVSKISEEAGQYLSAWDDELNFKYLGCMFGREGMSSAYGFHLLTKYSTTGEVKKAKEMEGQYPGMIVHFLMPAMLGTTINPDLPAVEKALEDNPGFFRGIGELKMYDGKNPDDPYVLQLLDLAREYKLIVMMHPFNHHKAGVEKMVKQYTDVTFLFHGIDYVHEKGDLGIRDNREWLKELIANNNNVYYSIDGGLPIFGWLERHVGTSVSKEEMLPYLKSQFKNYLEQEVLRYKNLIELYPDRFLRGTDRMHPSHYDKEVSALMEEYSRALIGRLDPSVQEKFAHKNAEKLLEIKL